MAIECYLSYDSLTISYKYQKSGEILHRSMCAFQKRIQELYCF